MKFVNLTPHAINVIDKINLSIAPSGKSLRVSQELSPAMVVEGVTFYKATYGVLEMVDNETKEVDPPRNGPVRQTPLPPMMDDTVYIVSGQCLEALKGLRSDFAAPGELVRDEAGKPVGCKGLRIN